MRSWPDKNLILGSKNLILGSVLSAAAYGLLAYFTPRTQFYQLLLLFGLAFTGYLLLLRSRPALLTGLLLALGFRLLFLAATPQLSDDYFRFFWDGTLVVQGESPYLYLPADLVAGKQAVIPGLSQALFSHLNSPYYYSVYPPLCQAVFGLARWLAGDSLLLANLVMRLLLLAAEAGTVLLLVRALKFWQQPVQRAWLYAFNPLVIVELTGNLHFEALMIFFLTASLYWLWQGRRQLSALALGLSIGVKLLPLMFLPFFWAYLGWKRFLGYASLVALVLVVLFLPFLSPELIRHLFNSLNLYFQKFEFNASWYYLLRWLGFRLVGYYLISLIGPLLSLVTAAIISYLAWRQPKAGLHLPGNLLLALSVYLFLATVVHPWYVTTLVMLACLAPWRYPLVWSALAVLSYAAYQTEAYRENLWLVATEYLLVYGTLLVEIVNRYSLLVTGKPMSKP
jgi:alpha-1,6-mannosyltransferase